ncbi:MAG: group II intron reverse transcriptase/maturase [Acetobacteraceae bacterium]|nr:group II intron reverse transcriptase/maturase [Acetobacteraceae bacterium]
MTDTNDGRTPVAVPAEATRAGEAEAPARSYAEPSVWTERMLATLEQGVKGGKWYSLMDKVWAERTLKAATARVVANKGASGVDHVTVEMFETERDANLARLSETLRTGEYRPQAIRRHYIPKPGSQEQRPLGIPTVRDRVVQTAMRMALEPIFERDFATHSYGFRPGRGCKDALRRVDELLKDGAVFVVDADLKSFFDTIPHDRLLAEVGRKVTDGRIMRLLQQFLRQGVLDGLAGWTPEEGTPQGAVISPLLSNIYLDPLDHLMAGEGFEMVRYADDFVVLCRNEAQAARALARIAQWTAKAGLALHPDKTRIVDAQAQSFEFLGYRFADGRRWPRSKSERKLKDALRAQTRRTAGTSLRSIIDDLNPVLRGWFGYYKHSHRRIFSDLDGWIRSRLRSLLRRRRGRDGIARGDDHRRWPNAFFAEHGLFSLQHAHALACQPPRG